MTMTLELILSIAVAITTLVGAGLAISQILKPIKAMLTEWKVFMRDWAGEPARDGRDAIPGVMERLNNIDGELKRNGGKSIKDTVNRIEKRLIEGDRKFEELSARIAELEQKVG
jgi:hypothetical protein